MKLEMFSALEEEISKEDWERMPASIQRLLRWLLESHEARLAELEEAKLISGLATEQAVEAQKAGQVAASARQKELRCSFCGKGQEEVEKLVAGRDVYICNECVGICNAIMEGDES